MTLETALGTAYYNTVLAIGHLKTKHHLNAYPLKSSCFVTHDCVYCSIFPYVT